MSDKQELAEDRTDWAEDRTVLANERTFAGWMRTGMASVAIALGLKAVFGAVEPTWLAKAASSLFIAVSLLIYWGAWRNALRVYARLNPHSSEPASKTHLCVVVGSLSIGSVVCCIVLWLI
ncbi:DUF202 domain-containing protein [Ruegeria atlantica]|uniref:DUF202 domain-containing protein n=1 Tax=Ruegeria atlantica TaxID=81569 RepID=A0AA90YZT9_9RHOB|nr:DUF202 domain-containing protein [Ruegeria atlantica]NOE20810.1 DUF202 domain-containing protein [Ruegeria atlantica]